MHQFRLKLETSRPERSRLLAQLPPRIEAQLVKLMAMAIDAVRKGERNELRKQQSQDQA